MSAAVGDILARAKARAKAVAALPRSNTISSDVSEPIRGRDNGDADQYDTRNLSGSQFLVQFILT